MSHRTRIVLMVSVAAAVGIGTGWLSSTGPGFFLSPESEGVLTALETAQASGEYTRDFNTVRSFDRLYVHVRLQGGQRAYTLRLKGADTLLQFGERKKAPPWIPVSSHNAFSFTLGKDTQPGTFRLSVEQGEGNGTILVILSDRPIGMTGWQLLSRAYLTLFVLLLAACLSSVKWGTASQRLAAQTALQTTSVALAFIVLYLLLHEGGHALPAIAFGNFSLRGSDFLGIGGTPHAGLKPGAQVAPWQRATVSIGGPLLPILAAMACFLWWRSKAGQQLRARYESVEFVFSTLILGFLLTAIVFPAFALGLVSDGDWRGFSENVPGGAWTRQGLVWSVFTAGALGFVRVLPFAYRSWHTFFQKGKAIR